MYFMYKCVYLYTIYIVRVEEEQIRYLGLESWKCNFNILVNIWCVDSKYEAEKKKIREQ